MKTIIAILTELVVEGFYFSFTVINHLYTKFNVSSFNGSLYHCHKTER